MVTSREPLIEERRTPDGLLVLSLRNGRLNTLTRPLRTSLIEALDRAEAAEEVRAVVLRGEEGVFSAGADLSEFDSGEGLAEPSLHGTILAFLDGMRTPVVALIEGMALGGGLELALGCHYRIADPDAQLGLPEITFGFLPGAGGTQRLPRAVGLERGLSLVLTGRRVAASELEGTALISSYVGEDALGDALGFAASIAGRPGPRLRDVGLGDEYAEAVLAVAARSWKALPAGAAAVSAVRAGLGDVDRGFEAEQERFRQLARTAAASARRHLFLSERAAKRRPRIDGEPRTPERVAVVGGGTMGRGIALAHALAGLSVHVVETDAGRADAARAALASDADRAARSRGSVDAAAEVIARVRFGTDLTELADADLVIEAVPEIMDLKRDVFTRLDAIVRPGAILATNTSSLDVDRIAAATARPGDVVGAHFFAPAHLMRLLEIVRGAQTTDETLAAMLLHAGRLGKTPVVSRVAPGFIGNRILEASSREVGLLLLEGAAPAQIDGALERWGMRMGPLRVLDLVGNDVPMHTRREAGTDHRLEWRPSAALVAAGRLGLKTGRGWYRYVDGRPEPDEEVEAMLRALAAEAGVSQRPITDDEIVERAVLAMVNEGVAVLEEGVAARAGDIDVVFTNGYGYPKDRGGPMHTADTIGLRNVVRIMRRFARRRGGEHWEPRPLLLECAQNDAPLAGWGGAR